MAKKIFNRRVMALLLALVMCFSMLKVTALAAPARNNWSYAYYLGQEYLGNAAGAAVKPDPVGYGFQGVITELTFADDAGKEWTFVWSSEANGEWRITGSNVSQETATAWPQVTSGKTYVGYCGSAAYTFTLSADGSAADWTYANSNSRHANWFYYIRFIREYIVNVYYQNETGSVIYNGEKFTAEPPLTNYFHFLYPDDGIISDSEYEDGAYTAPTILQPEAYLPQSMKDLGYEIKYATDAEGNDVLSSGVTISLLGENVLNVYCTLISPKTENYTVIHNYYTDGTYDGSHNGGSIEVEESADFAEVVAGITKETVYSGNTYGYVSYAVDAANKVITLTYTRQLPTYDYSVTYNGNGGALAGGEVSYGDSESVSGTKATAHNIGVDANGFVRENYSFAGWNTEADGSGTAYAEGTVIALTSADNTRTLYAQWQENPKYDYTVIYNANFGDSPATMADEQNAVQIYEDSYTILVNDCEFVRENYTFVGWATSPDGNVAYGKDDPISFTGGGSQILYAKWIENDKYAYSVIYNGNGGALSGGELAYGDSENIEETYAKEAKIKVDENTFARENHTFVGWNTAADGSGTEYTAEDVINLTFTDNTLTLFAQWEEHPKYDYTVIYNGNGGALENEAVSYGDSENIQQTYAKEAEIKVDENSFVRENYTFTGWNTAADGSGKAYSAEDVLKLTAEENTATLYAQWEENPKYDYTVIYEGNFEGAPEAMADEQNAVQIYKDSYTIDVNRNEFVRENYTFVGWNTAADGSGVAYSVGQAIALTAENNTVTLYAQWVEYPKYDYTVIYEANYEGAPEAKKDPESISGIYATSHNVEVDANSFFLRENYTFTGWNTKADGSGTAYAPGDKVQLTTDNNTLTLYAQWVENDKFDYTLIYNANFGESPATKTDTESVTQTYALSHSIGVDDNEFVRENYTFVGWNTAADGSGVAYSFAQTVALTAENNTVTLYAQWQENPKYDYTVIYNANFGDSPATMADEQNAVQIYDTTYTIGVNANEFVRENYTFAGWAYTPDGEVAVQAGDSISFAEGGSQTLYAKWIEHDKYNYTVIYNGNGGALENEAVSYGDSENIQQTYAKEAEIKVDENSFVRENYTFTGWNTAADGSGKAYSAEDALKLTAKENTATLYAQWEENAKYDYTVTYEGNFEGAPEAREDAENVKQTYAATYTIGVDANSFEREGYTFGGWATTPEGEAIYEEGDEISFTEGGSYTLYAVWTINEYEYTVEYMVRVDGGEYQKFTGELPEGAPQAGKAPYDTLIDEEYLENLPANINDGTHTYDFTAIDEITVPYGTNTVIVYYTYISPAPPAEDPAPPAPPAQQNGDGLVDIPDEDVPLADVPKTGDPMYLYVGMTALSGLGLLGLTRKKDEEDEEE